MNLRHPIVILLILCCVLVILSMTSLKERPEYEMAEDRHPVGGIPMTNNLAVHHLKTKVFIIYLHHCMYSSVYKNSEDLEGRI